MLVVAPPLLDVTRLLLEYDCTLGMMFEIVVVKTVQGLRFLIFLWALSSHTMGNPMGSSGSKQTELVATAIRQAGAGIATLYSSEQSAEELASLNISAQQGQYPIYVDRDTLDEALLEIAMHRPDLHVSIIHSAISSLGLSRTALSANGLREIYKSAHRIGTAIADRDIEATPDNLREIFLSDPQRAKELYKKGTMVNPDMKDLKFRHRAINSNAIDIRFRVLQAIRWRGPSGFSDVLQKAAVDDYPPLSQPATELLQEIQQ